MIVNIYTIKDELANNWGSLFLLNPTVAERSFKYMAQEMEKGDCEDRRIYFMGTYDPETGEIVPSRPTMVYNLEEAKKNGSQNL